MQKKYHGASVLQHQAHTVGFYLRSYLHDLSYKRLLSACKWAGFGCTSMTSSGGGKNGV